MTVLLGASACALLAGPMTVEKWVQGEWLCEEPVSYDDRWSPALGPREGRPISVHVGDGTVRIDGDVQVWDDDAGAWASDDDGEPEWETQTIVEADWGFRFGDLVVDVADGVWPVDEPYLTTTTAHGIAPDVEVDGPQSFFLDLEHHTHSDWSSLAVDIEGDDVRLSWSQTWGEGWTSSTVIYCSRA